MSRSHRLLVVTSFILLAGCNQSAPTPVAAPARAPAATAAAASSPAPSAPSTTVQKPANSSDPAKAEQPAATSAKEAKGNAADPGLSGLSQEDLKKKMLGLQRQGFDLGENDKKAEGYKRFQEAAKYARELRRRFPELPPEEMAEAGEVIYNEACALALGRDAAASFASLQEAAACGFADTELLDDDEDLVAVRKLPEFAAWRKEVEAIAAAHAKEEVRSEIASFKSYPFEFTLPDLDDKPLKLADLKGKVVIVDFWGTWCPPCRAEIPSFVKLQTLYGEKGLQIVGLGYERGDKTKATKLIRDFMKAHNMNYTCIIGDEATQEQVPEFEGYPTTLFIDRTGKVRLQYVGQHPYATLEAAVNVLLEEPAK